MWRETAKPARWLRRLFVWRDRFYVRSSDMLVLQIAAGIVLGWWVVRTWHDRGSLPQAVLLVGAHLLYGLIVLVGFGVLIYITWWLVSHWNS